MIDVRGKRVVVTGGAGFLGRAVVSTLQKRGCASVFAPRKSEFDLRERADIRRLFQEVHPDIVVHLAGTVGGIGANLSKPGTFFYENAIMGIELIEQARRAGLEKLVLVGTVCAYPKFCPVPFREDDLWNGYPEETNAPYGIAKKSLLVQAQAYRQEFGFNSIYLLPVNLYGPGDNFDRETSHVIPALIRKFLEAKEQKSGPVVVWGTGKATREFLYVGDAAEGIVLATERYEREEPVNIGSGFEISLKGLVQLIARLMDFEGQIEWDFSKPDGQPRRKLDTSRAEREFGFRAKVPFDEGLKKTIDWYLSSRGSEAVNGILVGHDSPQ
jgi:GDP-L-fucose synthase